jgi:hypothetical protein
VVKLPTFLLVHSVQVKPYAGRSSTGDVYGETFTLQCMAQGQRRLVRDGDGAETLSTLTLYCAPDQASSIPPGSVVVWKGDTTVVIGATDHDDGGLGAPQHTEVVCE